MKRAVFLCATAMLLIGCTETHQEPVAYYPTAPPPPSPTSDRPDMRVYSNPETSPTENVYSSDVAKADSISRVLKSDPHMASATANVMVTIKNGYVTLRGITPTEADRDEIVRRVGEVPGVVEVRDELGVDH